MNGVILLLVALVFSGTVLALMFAEERKNTRALVDDIAKSVAEDLNEQLSLINQLNKAVFLSYEMQDIIEEYRRAVYIDGADDFTEISLRATENIDRFVQLDQSLIKEAAFIPADYGGGYDAAHTLYYGLNVDTVSSNLGLIAETAAEEEYRRGGLFVADFLYDDLTSSNYYAFGRNVLELRSHSENYMQCVGIGVLAVNKAKLSATLARKDAVDGLEIGVFYKDGIFLKSEESFSETTTERGNFFVSEKYLPDFDARVVAYYGIGDYFSALLRSTAGTALAVLAVCIAVMLFFLFANRRTSAALRFLFGEFSEIKDRNKVRHIEYTKNREVDNVIENFNLMADSLTELNTEVLEEKNKSLQLQVEKIEFELASLYAQINKHFLINVLSAVRSLVTVGDTDKAKSCLKNLSEFLRYSLSMDNASTVEKELDSIKIYLDIQKVRFPKIDFEVSCEKEAGGFPMQKMILQPIIENAFVHSVKNKRGKIRLVCRRRAGGVSIFVADDGEGLTKEREREVNASLRGDAPEEIGGRTGNRIALANIQRRIRLSVGPRSVIRLRALENGALTYVRLVPGEEEDNV